MCAPCCISHRDVTPCMQVRQGYLWVWGDSSSMAPLQAAAKPPLLIPKLRDDDISRTAEGGPVLSGAHRYMRDVPYRCSLI